MREALIRVILGYSEIVGSSKIIVLFIISMIGMILLNENDSVNEKRRRINPAVFLSSIWSGIAYTGVTLISREKKFDKACGILISIIVIALSGGFVLSKNALEYASYADFGAIQIVISIILICTYFAIYFLISKELFIERSDRWLFIIIVSLLQLFSFYSEKASKLSLLLSPMSVSVIIIHGILPLLLWLYLKYEAKIKEMLIYDGNDEDTEDSEIPEEWDMKKHKLLNIRNMAIAFVAFILVFAAVVFVLNTKINTLYDATVMLENAANTKISVYELKEDDGSVTMTLMISPEGTVTVIDGAGKTNGTEAYELISKYADKVDKWYLYGEDDDSKGAYDFCVDQGMKVENTYLISGIEEID